MKAELQEIASQFALEGAITAIDSLGEGFLSYVKDGMTVTIGPNGTVTVE